MTESGSPASEKKALSADDEHRRSEMFPRLPDALVARLRAHGQEIDFEDGTVLIEQGDENVSFFVVVEGEIEVVHPTRIGHHAVEHPITIHGPQQFTGEMSLLSDRRSLVRCRAKGALRAIRVENADFRRLLQTDSDVSDFVMRAFILRRLGLLAAGYGDAVVIGSRDSAATLRLQAFLFRNGHPYRWVDLERDPDLEALLDGLVFDIGDIPLLICKGATLKNPTESEVAKCLGFNRPLATHVIHDVVVCGAGPAGLAAAVYAASEGLDVFVIEAGSPGGQAATSSKIENYLGFPTGISGQDLAGRASIQAEKFGARLLVARGAIRLHCGETPIRVELSNGDELRTRSVVIATGAEYRRLEAPGLSRFEGNGVYYAATSLEAQSCGEDEVIVVGGGNSAGQAATYLAHAAKHVHVLIRAADLSASMSRYLIRRIEETPNITVHRRTRVVGLDGTDHHLQAVTFRNDETGEQTTRPIRHLFSMTGAVPNTKWLERCIATDETGFVLTGADLDPQTLSSHRWPLARLPYLFETSQPRVFAVGDVRSKSVKRVASAVGEGSVCIQLVHKTLSE